ncbi:MAG TPA: hypothetical protein VF516_30175 [Kofleriaceae bacterium]
MPATDRPATAPSFHDCPGCGAAGVPQHQLACKPCWFRLPERMRDAINHAFRHRLSNPRAHRQAIVRAMTWYRINPT